MSDHPRRRLPRGAARSLALALLAAAAILLLPVSLPTGDDVAVPDNPMRRPLGPLTQGTAAAQEFPATGPRVGSVALLLGTGGRVPRGTLRVTLEGRDAAGWREIGAAQLPAAEVADNAFTPVPFPSPLAVTVGQPLRLTVRGDATEAAGAVTWTVNPDHSRQGYALTRNGAPEAGTARFEVRYARARGRLYEMAGAFVGRVTPLLDGFWRGLLLAAAAAFVLGGAVALGRRVPDNRAGGG